MPRTTLTRRIRGVWRFLRNPADRVEWAWLRYPWFQEGDRDTPLPVIIAQLRVGLKTLWDTRDRVAKLETGDERLEWVELKVSEHEEDIPSLDRRLKALELAQRDTPDFIKEAMEREMGGKSCPQPWAHKLQSQPDGERCVVCVLDAVLSAEDTEWFIKAFGPTCPPWQHQGPKAE